jgi:hypothetical protein
LQLIKEFVLFSQSGSQFSTMISIFLQDQFGAYAQVGPGTLLAQNECNGGKEIRQMSRGTDIGVPMTSSNFTLVNQLTRFGPLK